MAGNIVDLKFSKLDTHVALLGWDERFHSQGASYRINLGESAPISAAELSLVFGASNAAISSLPKSFHPKGVQPRGEEGREPLDWSIVLRDAEGAEA